MPSTTLLILNYHRLYSQYDARLHSRFDLHKEHFFEHIQLIRALQIPIVPIKKCLDLPPGSFSVAITFDDGNLSDYEMAFPFLKESCVPASFFPVVNEVGTMDKLTWRHIAELHNNGFEIESHGLDHIPLDKLTVIELKKQIVESKRIIENKIHSKVTKFSLPYGVYTQSSLTAIEECDYRYIFSTEKKNNEIRPDSILFHRYNMHRNIKIEWLEKLLYNKGKLSPVDSLIENIQSAAKKLVGTDVSNTLNRIIR